MGLEFESMILKCRDYINVKPSWRVNFIKRDASELGWVISISIKKIILAQLITKYAK